MLNNILGIHHITSIAGDTQENFDFYTKVLGLRFVKKTINFDSPSIYHLYFGDDRGNPGTVITFFPTVNGPKGRTGGGQVEITSYGVPENSLEFWENRLSQYKIDYKKRIRFKEKILSFRDTHGLEIEIVERKEGSKNIWEFEDINSDFAIKGFSGAVFNSYFPKETSKLLDKIMGFEKIDEDGKYIRFRSKGDIGNIIDIRKDYSNRGKTGIGTVHHIAFRAYDLIEQIEWKKLLEKEGYNVTDIKDRKYFTSIYFRGKDGILYEIATNEPGFLVDENYDELGKKLKLPLQYEKQRNRLEKELDTIIY